MKGSINMMPKEEKKQELREELSDMVMAVKIAMVTLDHTEPGTGDLVVEVLTEEIGKLHSKYADHSGAGATHCVCRCEDDTCGEENGGWHCCDEKHEDSSCEPERDPFVHEDLSFSQALEAAKHGARIARKGWNGKGQFVFVADDLEFHTEADLSALEGEVYVHSALVFCGTSGIQVGWLASQADMLSEDWFVME